MSRRVILWMQQTVDGFFEGPNGEFDWPIVLPEMNQFFNDKARTLGAFLYGRKVFEMMAGFWPTADQHADTPQTAEFARIWKPMPKFVFSRTLDRADWNTTVLGGDLVEEVSRLKEQDGGDLALFGGAEIAGEFMRLDLVDEYHLFTHPVVLGGGTALFGRLERRLPVRLVEATTFDPGVVLLRHERVR
jgi:dihydrofolate reductase